MKTIQGLAHGIYEIYWNEGGSSLASVGYLSNGDNWFAPCNWIDDYKCKDWTLVKAYKLLREKNKISKIRIH